MNSFKKQKLIVWLLCNYVWLTMINFKSAAIDIKFFRDLEIKLL